MVAVRRLTVVGVWNWKSPSQPELLFRHIKIRMGTGGPVLFDFTEAKEPPVLRLFS